MNKKISFGSGLILFSTVLVGIIGGIILTNYKQTKINSCENTKANICLPNKVEKTGLPFVWQSSISYGSPKVQYIEPYVLKDKRILLVADIVLIETAAIIVGILLILISKQKVKRKNAKNDE